MDFFLFILFVDNYVYLKLDGTNEYQVVPSTSRDDILAFAMSQYHVDGGKIYVLFENEIAECPIVVDEKSKLCFKPKFYSLQFSYRTFTALSSLQLISKCIAKASGHGQSGIDGYCCRVDSISVSVVVRSLSEKVLETFLSNLRKVDGITINEEILRKTEYGVLQTRFEVNPNIIVRDDGGISLDKDENSNSSRHSAYLSMYT